MNPWPFGNGACASKTALVHNVMIENAERRRRVKMLLVGVSSRAVTDGSATSSVRSRATWWPLVTASRKPSNAAIYALDRSAPNRRQTVAEISLSSVIKRSRIVNPAVRHRTARRDRYTAALLLYTVACKNLHAIRCKVRHFLSWSPARCTVNQFTCRLTEVKTETTTAATTMLRQHGERGLSGSEIKVSQLHQEHL